MNPYDRLRRFRPARLAVITFVVAAFVGIVAGPASAATGCTYNAATQTVAFTLDDNGILTVGTGADNGKILWDNDTSLPASQGQCGAATVTNTDTVNVTGDGDPNTFVMDETGGLFAPGNTSEASGSSEIEFSVDLAAGTDTYQLNGQNVADSIVVGNNSSAGQLAVNIDGDDDPDLTSTDTNTEHVTVNANSGDDSVSFQGGSGTGAAYTAPGAGIITANGGNNNDTIKPSLSANVDSWNGDSGLDTIDGSALGVNEVFNPSATQCDQDLAGDGLGTPATATYTTTAGGADAMTTFENFTGGSAKDRFCGSNVAAN